jgi:putative endonuclease
MSLKTEFKQLGAEGEDAAVRYLKEKGFTVIHRNYKTPIGEADIVAADKGATVFIEVKTRSSERFGEPFEAVNIRKREKLKKIALYYQKHEDNKAAIRFDVVSIKCKDERYLIEHIEEAF